MRRSIVLCLVIAACAPAEVEKNNASSPRLDLPGGGSSTPGAGAPSPIIDQPRAGDALPAPISGGTVQRLERSGGRLVVVADPDAARVSIINLDSGGVRSFRLDRADAPGRIAELAAGSFAVALSRDAVALFKTDEENYRRVAACALPRGMAYDAPSDRLLVACREGKLIALDRDGLLLAAIDLPADLRDVVVSGDRIFVTRFKSAETLILDRDLTLLQTVRFPVLLNAGGSFVPAVAWRAAASPGGGIYVLHQRANTIVPATGFGRAPTVVYYSPCPTSVVLSTLSHVDPNGAVRSAPAIEHAALAVDLAVRGDRLLIADAGAGPKSSGHGVRRFDANEIEFSPATPGEAPEPLHQENACPTTMAGSPEESPFDDNIDQHLGPISGVTFDQGGAPIALIHTPQTLLFGNRKLALGSETQEALGFRLFHQDPGGEITCASCHPLGEDDGLVWQLTVPRRTPMIAGGLRDSAPFHWSGDLPDLEALLIEVFEGRMRGGELSRSEATALASWIENIPAVAIPRSTDQEAAIDRGRGIFSNPAVGCATCHFGPRKNATIDVGTGEALQVPVLRGLMFRAPYLHDGCAKTLSDRFGSCATRGHGVTHWLTAGQINDLSAYLLSL